MSLINITDVELERQAERVGAPARGFLLVAAIMAVPGLFFVVTDLASTLGLVLLAFASLPCLVGLALLVSGFMARWAARHKLFA